MLCHVSSRFIIQLYTIITFTFFYALGWMRAKKLTITSIVAYVIKPILLYPGTLKLV
jgi:hypothetical protein